MDFIFGSLLIFSEYHSSRPTANNILVTLHMKMTAFYDIAQCSLFKVDRCFKYE
jgi:hypothetical protein